MEQNKYKNHYHDQEPVLKEKGVSKIREHLTQGMTLFVVVIACILCYFAILRFDVIARGIKKVVDILKPIIYGTE